MGTSLTNILDKRLGQKVDLKPLFSEECNAYNLSISRRLSETFVQDVCPRCLSKMFVQDVCPRRLSKMFVQNVCPRCLSKTFVQEVCPRRLSKMFVQDFFSRYLPTKSKTRFLSKTS